MSSDTGPATVFSRDESTNFRYALQPGKCIRGQTNPPATISYPRGVDEMDGTRCGTWTRSTSVLIAENHGISARTCPGIDMVSTTERAGPLPHRPGQEAGPRSFSHGIPPPMRFRSCGQDFLCLPPSHDWQGQELGSSAASTAASGQRGHRRVFLSRTSQFLMTRNFSDSGSFRDDVPASGPRTMTLLKPWRPGE